MARKTHNIFEGTMEPLKPMGVDPLVEDENYFRAEKYRIIDVYCAHGDGGDEYHTGPVIGFFRDKYSAVQAAKGQGWYGGDGGTSDAHAIEFEGGHAYLLASVIPVDLDNQKKKLDADLKQKALSKLTAEDKRVLGIKDV